MVSDPTPWSLLTVDGALLAFLVGFSTVIGRERKSPYVINRIVWVFCLAIISALLALLAAVFGNSPNLVLTSAITLLFALGLTAWHVYKVAIRFALYVDSAHPKTLPLFTWAKDMVRRIRSKPVYEHYAEVMPHELLQEMLKNLEATLDHGRQLNGERIRPASLAIALEHHEQANKALAEMVFAFLDANLAVQYTTASRHPIEFVSFLKDSLESRHRPWSDVSKKLVVVDAYTPHFGFADSIYRNKDRGLSALGIEHIKASPSYAGIHTASSSAFNIIKKRANLRIRQPVLVVYENCFALTDLESIEQYRIFLRHVIPSERLWGGMFTVFLETALPKPEWDLLRSYTSIWIDIRSPS